MLDCILKAVAVKGRRNAAIARDISRDPATVTAWFSGKNPIPHRVRTALDTAIGAPVDWAAYDAEFAAMARRAAPAPAPAAPASRPAPPAPRQAAPAQRPAEARQRPAAPDTDGWGDQTPPKAPAPAPAPRRGLFAGLLSGGDDPSFGGLL